MDERKAAWFLEFLIREPLDDWVLHRLVSVLPVANGNIRLKKSLILRGIYSDILKDSISEEMLELLEAYERLVHQEGSRALNSMKKAYHDVAVECCVRFLREEYGSSEEFVCAVDHIWNGRVSALEMLDGCNLITDQLKKSKKKMVAAIRNNRVRNSLLGKDIREEAMDSIRAFREESMKEMGPPFLEILARQHCGEGKGLKQILDEHPHEKLEEMIGGNVLAMKHDDMSENTDRKFPFSLADLDVGSVAPGAVKAPIRDVNSSVGRSCANPDSHAEGATDNNGINNNHDPLAANAPIRDVNCSVGRSCADQDSLAEGATNTDGINYNHDPLATNEVRKLQRTLIASYRDLKSIVKDPLPEALEAAEKLAYNNNTRELDAMIDDKNQNRSTVDRHDAPISETCGESSTAKQNDKNHNGMSMPSFMTRNQTAQTYKWNDDELDDPVSDNPSHSKGVHLHSPTPRVISPLKVQDAKKFARRRRIKRWSTLEEETLRQAVLKYGKGNWKLILQHYPTVFEDRTEIDLKDKWRNMVR